MADEQPEQPEVAASSAHFKFPTFWAHNITMWIKRVEIFFTIHKITTEKSRFNYVVASMDEQVMMEVSDIISEPAVGREYTALKQAMIDRFGESNNNRIRRVLEGLTLGDRTPSGLYRIMQTTAGANMNETTLRTIWLSRLPERVAEIISAQEVADTDISIATLAKMADRIHAQSRPTTVAAVSTAAAAAPADPVSQLCNQISALTQRLSRMEQWQNNQSRRPSSPNRQQDPQQRSRSRGRLYNGLCYFHKKFGANARNCSEGCNFSPAASGNGQPQH